MQYRIHFYDTTGRLAAVVTDAPLVEVVRRTADQADVVRGAIPASIVRIGLGFRVCAYVEDALVCDAIVTRVTSRWGDMRKLILDRYVRVHELVEFEGEQPAYSGDATVSRASLNREIGAIVRDLINCAIGRVHYSVAHEAYPEGACREWAKFCTRRTPETALELGGWDRGQWVSPDRIDATQAFARDGRTITGLVVDAVSWPDVRLMLIDCEELTRNARAIARHPEVAEWTDAQYEASDYKRRALGSLAALQALLDAKGIDHLELNPHRDSYGAFDGRLGAEGRCVALVFGSGECLNAAMVELGSADVFLEDDGEGSKLVPEMELKDFFSYAGAHQASIESTGVALSRLDISGGLFEALTALAYAAGGYAWGIEHDQTVRFRPTVQPDLVCFFEPTAMAVDVGAVSTGLVNIIRFSGNPLAGAPAKTYGCAESVAAYGEHGCDFAVFAISTIADADALCAGLLADVAYPRADYAVTFFNGRADVRVGDVVEMRGETLRRMELPLTGEWGGLFARRIVGRVSEVIHRFSGRCVATEIRLTSPLRSVADPLSFIVRTQPAESTLYQFRLDDSASGCDLGVHLD